MVAPGRSKNNSCQAHVRLQACSTAPTRKQCQKPGFFLIGLLQAGRPTLNVGGTFWWQLRSDQGRQKKETAFHLLVPTLAGWFIYLPLLHCFTDVRTRLDIGSDWDCRDINNMDSQPVQCEIAIVGLPRRYCLSQFNKTDRFLQRALTNTPHAPLISPLGLFQRHDFHNLRKYEPRHTPTSSASYGICR